MIYTLGIAERYLTKLDDRFSSNFAEIWATSRRSLIGWVDGVDGGDGGKSEGMEERGEGA